MKTKTQSLAVALGLMTLLAWSSKAQAQTTWGGSHIFNGNVNVGTTGTTGNLLVTGNTGNSAPPGLKVTGDGGVVFSGTHGVGQIPATGAGQRFMWYPKKGAIRAGGVTGNLWDDAQVGEHSAAFGFQVWAGQPSTFVTGGYSSATDTFAAAFNGGTTASGQASASFNYFTTSSGIASFAAGYDTLASGYSAVSFGQYTEATGLASAAFGHTSLAVGEASMATGSSTVSYGDDSLASGQDTYAGGTASLATGIGTYADAYAATVIGRWNVGGGEGATWEEEDPLFEIGNGTGDENDPPEVERRNAFTVYKSGKIHMQRQGDVPMGEFGNPE